VDSLLADFDFDGDASTVNGIAKFENITASELGRLGIFDASGTGAKLTVAIYDMQYEPGRITMPEDERRKLPPSIGIPGAGGGINDPSDPPPPDIGAYLVRATLEVNDRESILESAVLQANNK
jgi:hypothetical protein